MDSNSNNLSSRAMLASLNISRWQATRTDRKITSEVAQKYNVSERRAGKWRKFAIDIEAPAYANVCRVGSALRERHYFHTLPWGQDGARILLARNFQRYSDDIRRGIMDYQAASAAFVAAFPKLHQAARAELGDMYNEQDYPVSIARHFNAELHIMPLPAAGDFRVKLAQDEVEQIRSDISSAIEQTTRDAMREPYQRLYDHIGRMVKQLGNPKGIVRDSLVGGLQELCGILPALNLTNDPQLEQLCIKARALTAHTPQELRLDSGKRAKIAEQAAQIYDTMGAFMGVQS